MEVNWAISLAVIGVLFIGISKAGFGGGLGMLTTPLCVFAFGAKDAIGILLPLLSLGDAFSLYHYWKRWRSRNLLYLLPGAVIGIVVGVQLIGRFSARELNLVIGLLAVSFVIFQWVKEGIFRAEGAFQPNHSIGVPCGIGAGITSSFAHGAGPVVSLFLVPQKMPKEIYVGTTVLVFTWINWIKMPFFLSGGIINLTTLKTSLLYAPLVPLGVWIGLWLNRQISELWFMRVIYILILAAGIKLILGT